MSSKLRKGWGQSGLTLGEIFRGWGCWRIFELFGLQNQGQKYWHSWLRNPKRMSLKRFCSRLMGSGRVGQKFAFYSLSRPRPAQRTRPEFENWHQWKLATHNPPNSKCSRATPASVEVSRPGVLDRMAGSLSPAGPPRD